MITTDSGEQVEALAPIIIRPAGQRISRPFMSSGSLIVWPRGIVFGIIRLIGGRCMCRLSGVSNRVLDKEPEADITLFA